MASNRAERAYSPSDPAFREDSASPERRGSPRRRSHHRRSPTRGGSPDRNLSPNRDYDYDETVRAHHKKKKSKSKKDKRKNKSRKARRSDRTNATDRNDAGGQMYGPTAPPGDRVEPPLPNYPPPQTPPLPETSPPASPQGSPPASSESSDYDSDDYEDNRERERHNTRQPRGGQHEYDYSVPSYSGSSHYEDNYERQRLNPNFLYGYQGFNMPMMPMMAPQLYPDPRMYGDVDYRRINPGVPPQNRHFTGPLDPRHDVNMRVRDHNRRGSMRLGRGDSPSRSLLSSRAESVASSARSNLGDADYMEDMFSVEGDSAESRATTSAIKDQFKRAYDYMHLINGTQPPKRNRKEGQVSEVLPDSEDMLYDYHAFLEQALLERWGALKGSFAARRSADELKIFYTEVAPDPIGGDKFKKLPRAYYQQSIMRTVGDSKEYNTGTRWLLNGIKLDSNIQPILGVNNPKKISILSNILQRTGYNIKLDNMMMHLCEATVKEVNSMVSELGDNSAVGRRLIGVKTLLDCVVKGVENKCYVDADLHLHALTKRRAEILDATNLPESDKVVLKFAPPLDNENKLFASCLSNFRDWHSKQRMLAKMSGIHGNANRKKKRPRSRGKFAKKFRADFDHQQDFYRQGQDNNHDFRGQGQRDNNNNNFKRGRGRRGGRGNRGPKVNKDQ